MTTPTTGEPPAARSGPAGWIVMIVFWLGIIVYNSGIVDYARDRIFVEPVLTQAFDLESKGGEEAALPMLLDLTADYPRNPRLLWALGDIYTKMDRPVLAHLYFHALSQIPLRSDDLKPGWADFMIDWVDSNSNANHEIDREVEEMQAAYAAYEHTYHTGVIIYPASINSALNQPASTIGVVDGYIPPDHPIPCGADQPRCGYAFQFAGGDLWTAIRTQKLAIAATRGGPDCCSVSLNDPDLRTLSVAEEAFVATPEVMDGRLSAATQDGQRLRLALRSRILVKQRFVLGFTDAASTTAPAQEWGIWSWVLLAGWIAATFLIAEVLSRGYRRVRRRISKS